jgi:hypothetical protein
MDLFKLGALDVNLSTLAACARNHAMLSKPIGFYLANCWGRLLWCYFNGYQGNK